jgi:hypothetical protein
LTNLLFFPENRMISSYLSAFDHAIATEHQQWISPYTPPTTPGLHQFVLFLKPEVTALRDGVNVQAVLELLQERLEFFGVTLHAARALPAAYLETHSILDQHYGVINRISKLGLSALSESALHKLHEVFAADLANGARVLGGHQFLAEQKAFSALSLCTLSDNVGTTKLGGGSYALRVNIQGHLNIILNPFHAWQLVPYTTPGNAILVLEGRSTREWKSLRSDLTGATNPAKASPGSLRAELLARKDALGLRDVNQGSNGIHLSAGPLEGMVELQRFFSDHDTHNTIPWSNTAFGAQLVASGKSESDVADLAANPSLERAGKSISAFDLTEERNAVDAIGLLA